MANFLSKNIFKNGFIIKFDDQLWKLFPTNHNILLCETRNLKEKIAKFHVVDLDNGNFLWHNLIFDTLWWIGVEGVFDNVILFHEYERPDFPIHKNIIAVDLLNKNIIYRLPDHRFIFATNKYLYSIKSELEKDFYYRIDLKNGFEIDALSYDEIKYLYTTDKYIYEGVEFPTQLRVDEIEDYAVRKYFSDLKNKNTIVNDVDLLDIKNPSLHIVGYSIEKYINDRILFDDYLCIIDKKGKSRYIDKIVSNANQVFPIRFFLHKGKLIFIKDKMLLSIMKVW